MNDQALSALEQGLQSATLPGAHGNLLARGLARGSIWREGSLPAGSPEFSSTLTEDLLDFGVTILTQAVRVSSESPGSLVGTQAFLTAGEAIEAAIDNGAESETTGFHRLSAAVAYHLGGFGARAYSMLRNATDRGNLSPMERAVAQLIRRRLESLHEMTTSWLLGPVSPETLIASRLQSGESFDHWSAADEVLTTLILRAHATFHHALVTGDEESAAGAVRQMSEAASAAIAINAVPQWWCATLSGPLFRDLWLASFHRRIGHIQPGDPHADRWSRLRSDFITRLRRGRLSAIEFWPSQFAAAIRALDPTDDLVVALPTSAGKTRIAELCILRALAGNCRVVYVTPLRALSAQIERDLGVVFRPLGFTVSSLYGSAGIESADARGIATMDIVVSTPEKLDFALRSNPGVIDDVGLIVLDEGHMIGPNEREVRYEALVQRLVRRGDREQRRLVCLSALFPDPAEMMDLVGWIRQADDGLPVHSTWRPTRQRYGTLVWNGEIARLAMRVGDERPFIPRFVEAVAAPTGSNRRSPFPKEKNELTLAAAWKFVGQNKKVIVYCAMRKSVMTLGRLVLKLIEQRVLTPLVQLNSRIDAALRLGEEWLGSDHPAVECLRYGIALHHAGLPRPFLAAVEDLLRSGDCPLTISSPTLAQGVNLTASVLIIPSIWRNREIIPVSEFANITGRAGRAFVDLEGTILHVVWPDEDGDTQQATRNWEELVDNSKTPRILSGILQLCIRLYRAFSKALNLSLEEVLEYLTGNYIGWSLTPEQLEKVKGKTDEWERDLASLDAAVLALVDSNTQEADVPATVSASLEGSLFARQLPMYTEAAQELLSGFLAVRANLIWSLTDANARSGFHRAGIGLLAGAYLDERRDDLSALLIRGEGAIREGNQEAAARAAVDFAEVVFNVAPFRPREALPASWKEGLRRWLLGAPGADVIKILGEDGTDILQDGFCYRLPWAMEALRVIAREADESDAFQVSGLLAQAVETGTLVIPEMLLLRSGLASREAAQVAAGVTTSPLDSPDLLREWLESTEAQELAKWDGWPTVATREAWLTFLDTLASAAGQVWHHATQSVDVEWQPTRPEPSTAIWVEESSTGETLVVSPALFILGKCTSRLQFSMRDIVGVRQSGEGNRIEIDYFGSSVQASR